MESGNDASKPAFGFREEKPGRTIQRVDAEIMIRAFNADDHSACVTTTPEQGTCVTVGGHDIRDPENPAIAAEGIDALEQCIERHWFRRVGDGIYELTGEGIHKAEFLRSRLRNPAP